MNKYKYMSTFVIHLSHPRFLHLHLRFFYCSYSHTVSLSHFFMQFSSKGSQWKDAAGAWLKEDCFGDQYREVSIYRFWNYFQKHFLQATKQDVNSLRRPLYLSDFNYILNAKFKKQIRTVFSLIFHT
jgi:hypothetical protein